MNSASPTKREKWREDIKRDFPQLSEQDDLIERLPPKDQWQSGLADSIPKIGHQTNKVESIALEHAARLCEANRYVYELATLQDYLREQRAESKQREKKAAPDFPI